MTHVKRQSRASIVGEAYPIRTVASLTGVKPITLRAWERRYGLIRPVRTAKGHRLYTREQIDLINQVVALTEKGMSISQVGRALQAAEPDQEAHAAESGPWAAWLRQSVAAVGRFDEHALDDVYNDALTVYPIAIVTRNLLLPLLRELGRRWADAEGGVAEEHFFSVYIRNKLGARFHHRSRLTAEVKLLGACLPGEYHEVGLLLFALAAHETGCELVLLGANTPLEELAPAVRHARCQAVILSSSIDPGADVVGRRLAALVTAAGVPVFVGGAASVSHRDAMVAAGAIPLGNDIALGVKRIGEFLQGARRAG